MPDCAAEDAEAALDRLLARLPGEDADEIRSLIDHRIAKAGAETARRLRVAQEAGRIGTYEICLNTGQTWGSPRFNEIFGLPPDHNPLDTMYWRSLLHPDDRDRVMGSLRQTLRAGTVDNRIEYRIMLNGEVRWVLSCDRIDRDEHGRAALAFGAVQDITEQKAYEALLWRAANEDALTGLANRKSFRAQLEAMLDQGGRTGLLVLDLDRLKQANDRYGHAAGDCLIRQTAERLRAAVPETAVLGRLGGDEFAVAAPVDCEEAWLAAAERISSALREPVRFGDFTIEAGCSVGAALYPDHASGFDQLMRAADVALVVTKLTCRGRCRPWRPGTEAELARLTARAPGKLVLAA